MSTELERRIRDMVERAESGSSEIDVSEVVGSARQRLGAPTRPHARRRTQIVLAAAAGVVLASAAGFVIARSGQGSESFQSSEASSAPTSDVEVPAAAPTPTPVPPPATVAAQPPPTTSVATPTADVPETLDQLRAAQASALAELPGFSATVEFRNPADGAEADVQISQVTMLADGSFWAEGDDLGWASYEPATQHERIVTPNDDGSFSTTDLIANGGNFLATSQYLGHDPTALVTAYGNIEITDIIFEGRPGWLVTSTPTPEFPAAPSDPTSAAPPLTGIETSRQLVDVETGLIVDSTTISTGVINYSQRTVLRDLVVTDTLPAAFPGQFPDGEDLQSTGNEPRRVVTPNEAASLFGLPLPMPSAVTAAGPTLQYDEGGYFNGINSNESAGVHRLVSIEFRTGFRSERVSISASAPDDPSLVLDWQTIVDGYQCTDNDSDGACDNAPQAYLSHPDGGPLDVDTVTISGGVLDGTTAIVNTFGVTLEFGVFLIGIQAETTERAIEIAETFVLVG